MDSVTQHPSLWLETTARAPRPAMRADVQVDVCILGGGLTGITTARLCKRAGLTVAVVEALAVGGGETGHTTAHLATHHDLYYADTIAKFGEEEARLILESRRAAIAQIESFVVDEGVSCAYERVPAFLFTEHPEGARRLEDELAACRRLGMDVSWSSSLPAAFPIQGAIRFANQAQFQPLRYLAAIAARISGDGSHLFEHTRVLSIDAGSSCEVHTDRGSIRCRDVVHATNTPLNAMGLLITRVAPYRTYAMSFRMAPSAAPLALLWDDGDPYHYVRAHQEGEEWYLIVGGEDHKVGTPEPLGSESPTDPTLLADRSWSRLEAWTRARLPVLEAAHRWSGQILEPADGLPYIGRYDDHVWVATGFAGDGMTNATLAAMLLKQQILGEVSVLTHVYDPKRLDVLASLKEYVRENLDFPKHLLGDRFKRPETERFRDVAPGEGMLVRLGKEKLAVHRDQAGAVHAFSPVCSHMGCLVHWNAAESSWDCPCHGSRFDASTGAVLNGPATLGLSPRDIDRPSAEPPARRSVGSVEPSGPRVSHPSLV